MTRSIKPNISTSVTLEIMTSPSVADFFVGWLHEQVQRTEREAREAGNSRAMAWEVRTLQRALGQYRPIAEALNRDEPAES